MPCHSSESWNPASLLPCLDSCLRRNDCGHETSNATSTTCLVLGALVWFVIPARAGIAGSVPVWSQAISRPHVWYREPSQRNRQKHRRPRIARSSGGWSEARSLNPPFRRRQGLRPRPRPGPRRRFNAHKEHGANSPASEAGNTSQPPSVMRAIASLSVHTRIASWHQTVRRWVRNTPCLLDAISG